MTMPHLCNCSHDPDGWCLDCVAEEHDRYEALLEEAKKVRQKALTKATGAIAVMGTTTFDEGFAHAYYQALWDIVYFLGGPTVVGDLCRDPVDTVARHIDKALKDALPK